MYRNLFYLAVIIVLLAAGYFMLRADGKLQAPAPAAPATAPVAGERSFSWRFAVTEETEDNIPRTDVALITNGDTYDLGGYPGTCAEIAPENLLPNEVSGVLCWWAGVGDELGVFLVNGEYVIRRGIQEEPTAETDGTRGNFYELTVLD